MCLRTMDIKKVSSVKSLRELLTRTAWLSQIKKHQSQISKKKSELVFTLRLKHQWKTRTYTQNSQNKIQFLHWKTLRKWKSKDQVAKEDKSNKFYKIECSNCEAVHFSDFKQSFKSRSDENKRSVKNYDREKNDFDKHCWEENHNFKWN